MAIIDLRLQHFRSYDDDHFTLSPGVNIIVGPNASGKTNILESVLLAARGSSYRARDAELVQFGCPWARIDAKDDAEASRIVKIECTDTVKADGLKNTAKKSFEIDGKKFIRMSQQKSLPTVLFEPNHLLLLSGSPELRRSYLDDLLEQTIPGFGPTRRQYRRVLAQRNALLKQGSDIARSQIFVWNIRLSELAGKIVRERLSLIAQINQMAGEVYGEISHTHSAVMLEYVSALNFGNRHEQYESALLHRFEHTLERDCMIGFTTAGPHRDDMRVLLDGHISQETASRGEVRTIILTLKILELQLLQAARGQSPLLLLDDVFSELDTARRQALTTFLQSYQTFITTTDADVVLKRFRDAAEIITLDKQV